MRYLLLVSHGGLAEGLVDALEVLLGPRGFVLACGLREGEGVEGYRDVLARKTAPLGPGDEVVLLADIAGGTPLREAEEVLAQRGLAGASRSLAGANLAMAISAVMGIEDGLGLDAIRDAMLDDGVRAVCG